MIVEALALGLSTGTYCSMYCIPVLVPFLFGTEKIGFKHNACLTGIFLGGRLAMYFVLGIVLSFLGILTSEFFDPVLSRKISCYAYVVCGLSLLANCNCRHHCLIKKFGNDFTTALVCGLSVGLHICPPLWTAMFRTMSGGAASRFYMLFFYIGSLPFFVPFFGIPFVTRKVEALRRVARVAKVLVGIYFVVFVGIVPIVF